MHYYIDGYNLLFRYKYHSQNLQDQRNLIISDLNKKISVLNLDISLVFDATYQLGEGSRSHYQNLEILFSAYGQTADQFIISELQRCSNTRCETIVTSDNGLARLARHVCAHTMNCEKFMNWINKSYENKIRLQKNTALLKATNKIITPLCPVVVPQPMTPTKEIPLDACMEYYASIFEAKWQQLIEEEIKIKQEIRERYSVKKRPRVPKKKKDLFFQENEQPLTARNDEERWLQIFERRIIDSFK